MIVKNILPAGWKTKGGFRQITGAIALKAESSAGRKFECFCRCDCRVSVWHQKITGQRKFLSLNGFFDRFNFFYSEFPHFGKVAAVLHTAPLTASVLAGIKKEPSAVFPAAFFYPVQVTRG